MTGTSILDRGRRAGLRLLTRAGSLQVLQDDDVRARVGRVLRRTTAGGVRAQVLD